MVTIVDRTGERKEFEYDKRIYSFGKKETQVLPLEVATWLFRGDHHFVHTTDGQWTRRYGVVDAPEDWLAEVGVDVLETASLHRDVANLEGWNAAEVDPLRARAKFVDLTVTAHRPQAGDYVNQGAAAPKIGG